MAKPKKLGPDTSYDSIFERLTTGTLLKTDYFFIASMFREWKGAITYRVLKAQISSLIQTQLRLPKKTEDSAKSLGRLEGLDAVLALIDQLSKFDEDVAKADKEEDIISPDQEIHIANESAPIQDIE